MVLLAPLAIGLSLVFVLIIMQLYYLLCWRKKAFSTSRLISIFQGSVRLHGDRALGVVHDLEVVTVNEGKLHPVDGERPILSDDLQLDYILEPPRFLFTINEETKDDMESDDGRSKRPSRRNSQGSSDVLRDLSYDSITLLETPFFTAPTSPIQTPPSSPIMNSCSLSRPLLQA